MQGRDRNKLWHEAYVKHDSAKVLFTEIKAGNPSDEFYDAKINMLSEMIKHHVKEATPAAAPSALGANMPADNTARVVESARNLAPNLGQRMLASRLSGEPVVIRELLPRDLKLEINHLTQQETFKAAHFLADVISNAHASQLDGTTRRKWHRTL